ncbi:serine protease [Pseudomonas sp. BN414]|uniref:serine protease n=1 Tax=Pseudomonas sp. BN414 TaxID=2567888 RepID=UPI0024557A1C|nr:serine protease [Pseudomonas sp. BN414]MDH4568425.1 serine protease [Pseudomonas sp. BN414]
MSMIKACLLLGALCAGCNGVVKPEFASSTTSNYFPVFSGFPLPYFYMASAVQWNEDYAVTTAHTPLIPYEKFRCSTGCDLVFFRHKAKTRIPSWRAAQPGESITSTGASPYLVAASGQGKVYPAPFINTDEDSGELYAIHDAPIAKGMSGGPVVAGDGSVVGINMGIYSVTLNDLSYHPGVKDAERISVFIPYAVILREWTLLHARLKSLDRRSASINE